MALSRLTAGVAHEVKNPLNAADDPPELLRRKLSAGLGPVRRPSSTLLRARRSVVSPAAPPPADLPGAGAPDVIGERFRGSIRCFRDSLKFA